jgi:hypothetical protein
MVIVEKGYVKPEYGRLFRVETRTEIIQRPVKGITKRSDSKSILEEFHKCKSKRMARRLWNKYRMMLKREERLFRDSDPAKEAMMKDLFGKGFKRTFVDSWRCKKCRSFNHSKRQITSKGSWMKSRCRNCRELVRVLAGESK